MSASDASSQSSRLTACYYSTPHFQQHSDCLSRQLLSGRRYPSGHCGGKSLLLCLHIRLAESAQLYSAVSVSPPSHPFKFNTILERESQAGEGVFVRRLENLPQGRSGRTARMHTRYIRIGGWISPRKQSSYRGLVHFSWESLMLIVM